MKNKGSTIIEKKDFIKEVQIFVNKKIRPFARSFEENHKIPDHIIQELADRKYLAAPFPQEYGGLDLDPVTYGLLTAEIGKGCSSTRTLLTVNTSLVGETLLRWGSYEQKEKYLRPLAQGKKIGALGLTEPNIGSDARNIETSYTKNGNTYILNGKKKWISLGNLADFFIIIARNNKEITAFLVDKKTPGLKIVVMKGLLAAKATYLAEIRLENVEVSAENIISNIGHGFSFIVSTALDLGRYSIAWAGYGIAEAALEEMVNYVRNRRQFNKKLFQFQLIKGIIADAVTKVNVAKALCMQAGNMREEKNNDSIIQTNIAKYYTSKIAMEIATDAVQIHGGNGCYNEYPVERLFREAKILEIIEGTSQIQQEIIANFGLKRYYNP